MKKDLTNFSFACTKIISNNKLNNEDLYTIPFIFQILKKLNNSPLSNFIKNLMQIEKLIQYKINVRTKRYSSQDSSQDSF